jgi:hypothetical protein
MALAARYLTVTQGNLNNNHLYLTKALDLFPSDVIGGCNAGRAASRCVRVHWGGGVVETDIDRSKNIFRKRAWLGKFFRANGVRAGDQVLLERLEPYVYRLSKPIRPSTGGPDVQRAVAPAVAGLPLCAFERPPAAALVRPPRSI